MNFIDWKKIQFFLTLKAGCLRSTQKIWARKGMKVLKYLISYSCRRLLFSHLS